MRKVKTHKFNGRRYNIFFGQIDGCCDQYHISEKDREIAILAAPFTKEELITIVHESLHASNWAATEEVVDRVSTEVGSLLWRLNYRRTE